MTLILNSTYFSHFHFISNIRVENRIGLLDWFDLAPWVGLQKNILRLRELVTIISKQLVIIPEQELRALLSEERFMQTGPGRLFSYGIPQGGAHSKHGAYFFSRNCQICRIKLSHLFKKDQ